jgi:hypothetical protein
MTTTSITFANKPLDKEEQHGGTHEITMKENLQGIICSHLTLSSFLPT